MKRQMLFCVVLGAAAATARAEMITLTHEGGGSGTIGGAPFAATDFVITALGDTDDREFFGDGWSIDHMSASISIDGVGDFDFITLTRTFVNNGGGIVGFSRGSVAGTDLFNGPSSPAFGAWDMTTSIGPISGSGSLLQWDTEDVMTSGGVLVFNDGVTDATFTALVPAPASLLLFGLAAAGTRRRR